MTESRESFLSRIARLGFKPNDRKTLQLAIVEEIKERLKVEIPVDEEPVSKTTAQEESSVDIVAELRDLGKQFATTLETAWNSEERQRVENEVRDGLKSFVDEVDKMIGDVRDPTGKLFLMHRSSSC